MVELNQRDRTIKVKIVYYGPALGGKTTNLKVLHERAIWSRRGELVSVNSRQDRTILCDLLPLKTGGFRGYDLRLQLLAVPGQALYAVTRRVVLKGADGVVFVANSATDRWNENQLSFEELNANLLGQQLDPASIPLVLQFNKRDLPDVMDAEALNRGLNQRHAPTFPAVAMNGKGVLETFTSILTLTMEDLCRRYRTIEMPPGQTVEAWARDAVKGIFGRAQLDGTGEPGAQGEAPLEAGPVFEFDDGRVFTPEPTEHRKVRVTAAEDASRAAASTAPAAEGRPPESLTESYAEASAELGFVVNELREERDLYRSRLADVGQALDLGEQQLPEEGLEARVHRILRVLVRPAGASNAALLLLTTDPPQVLALPPLGADPLSRTAWGNRHLEELRGLPEPRLEEGVESPDLTDALRAGEPSFDAVATVPLRSAERLPAVALLYYAPHVVLPTREALLHLGFLGRVLAGPLEAAAAREAESGARRLRTLSRATAAAVTSLVARLDNGATRPRRVDLADVLAPLGAPGVSIEVEAEAPPVTSDAPLLRFALATLILRCEALALEAGQRPSIRVRAAKQGDLVRVEVKGVGAAAMASGSASSDDAEMSVVQAIVDLHQGALAVPARGQEACFTIDLKPAP